MEKVSINKTFYSITKDKPLLKKVLIDLGFKPMENDKTYNTVGRVITLKKALNNIGVSVKEANEYLKEKKVEVEFFE